MSTSIAKLNAQLKSAIVFAKQTEKKCRELDTAVIKAEKAYDAACRMNDDAEEWVDVLEEKLRDAKATKSLPAKKTIALTSKEMSALLRMLPVNSSIAKKISG